MNLTSHDIVASNIPATCKTEGMTCENRKSATANSYKFCLATVTRAGIGTNNFQCGNNKNTPYIFHLNFPHKVLFIAFYFFDAKMHGTVAMLD